MTDDPLGSYHYLINLNLNLYCNLRCLTVQQPPGRQLQSAAPFPRADDQDQPWRHDAVRLHAKQGVHPAQHQPRGGDAHAAGTQAGRDACTRHS